MPGSLRFLRKDPNLLADSNLIPFGACPVLCLANMISYAQRSLIRAPGYTVHIRRPQIFGNSDDQLKLSVCACLFVYCLVFIYTYHPAAR